MTTTTMLADALFPFVRLGGLLAAVGLMGCAPVDAALDCDTICTRYEDCFDGSYDVSACASRCRSRSASDTGAADARNRCEACINDRACASATFNCAADCANVVP